MGGKGAIAICLSLHIASPQFAQAQIRPEGMPLPTTLPSAPDLAGEEFYLGVGDIIDIKVIDYDEYTSSQVILPDGSVILPIIGKVNAADRSPAQLSQELTVKLNVVLVNPVVTVSLNKLRPIRVNVAGAVQRPGPVQLQSMAPTVTAYSTNPLRAPTLSEALLQAGGITRDADIRQVLLKRYRPTGESPPITINLWEALRSQNAATDPLLRDGDTILVPKLAAPDSLDQRLTVRSSFAQKTVRVRVMGEVKSPGEVQVAPDSTLTGAIAIAGGPTDKADLGNVAFIRMSESGRIERQELDLKKLADEMQVQDGDVVMVPKRGFATFVDNVSPFLNPFVILLNLLR